MREPSGRLAIRRIRGWAPSCVDEQIVDAPDRGHDRRGAEAEVAADGLGALPWGERPAALRARLAFLHGLDAAWPDLSDDGSAGAARRLAVAAAGRRRRSLAQLRDDALADGPAQR